MSTQTIYHNTKDNLDKTITDFNIQKAKDYILDVKYGVKKCIDFEEIYRLNWLHSIICEDNCLLKEELKCLKDKIIKLTLK